MDWLSAIILGIALALVFVAWIRTIPKRRFVTFLFLLLPSVVLSLRWAAYRESWSTWRVGVGVAIVIILIWWILHGRTLPAPEDGVQRVWTKDDPF
jgi:hypothetical protein